MKGLEGITKIIIGAIIVAMLSWGTWVTVGVFTIEDITVCAAENKEKIEVKSGALQKQINTRMNKQDAKLDGLKRDMNTRMDKQEKKMDKSGDKLDKIMIMILVR